MFLIDKPYASDFVKKTLEANQYPVVKTEVAQEMLADANINFIQEDDAANMIKNNPQPILYTNSENAVAWLNKNLQGTKFLEYIKIFKDKAGLRERLKPMYPNFFFKKVPFEELQNIDLKGIKYPFMVKPAVGFFSLGVRKILSPQDYLQAIEEIKQDMQLAEKLYPKEVVEETTFVLEEVIQGDEFAIDCYYNNDGKPVVLNISKHLFASETDMSDRAYITSKEIIEENFSDFEKFLTDMGDVLKIKNFPAHIEVRKTADNQVIPIEVNPARFGGWCTTADLAYNAYGVNLYEIYQKQEALDFKEVLKDKSGKIYSLIILDNSTGVPTEDIKEFDYEKLLAGFENPLELRKIDYNKFPIFGFLFAETKTENFAEVEYIIQSRLNEFIQTK